VPRQHNQTVMNHFMTKDNTINVLFGVNVISIPGYMSSPKFRALSAGLPLNSAFFFFLIFFAEFAVNSFFFFIAKLLKE
jgi:hypothetical protein